MLCWDITPLIPHLTKGDFSAYKLTEREKEKNFKNNKSNIGNVCGAGSNVTVIDRDFIAKGVWDYIFNGVETGTFVVQARTTD